MGGTVRRPGEVAVEIGDNEIPFFLVAIGAVHVLQVLPEYRDLDC
jgi:hypothetical protein